MEWLELYNLIEDASMRSFANRAAHPPMRQPTEADLMARAEAVRVRSIRALISRGLESTVEQCVLTGKTLEEARAELLAEYNRRHPKIEDVSDDDLLMALGGI